MTFEEYWKANGVTSSNYPLVAETYKEVAKKAWDECKTQVLTTLLANKTIAYPSYCGTVGRPYFQETVIKEIQRFMKWIHNKSEVPKGPHFAIIEFSQYYVEGDERSRSAPGHGYPGGYESKCEYIVFENELEWKTEINKRMTSQYGNKDNFVALRATPASIELHTTVNVA